MKQNSKLSLALHALGHMGRDATRPMTSEVIAGFCATNPVVVRRVLGLLREAGLVRSEKGHAGGWTLAQDASAISVADVYRAIGERFMMQETGGPDLPSHCAIVTTLHNVVDEALAEAEAGLIARLERVRLTDLYGKDSARSPQ